MLDDLLAQFVPDPESPPPALADWRTHAVIGALLFFVLATFFGLWGSLLPLGMIRNLFWSVLLGAPIGYAISRYGSGPVRGGMIGAGAFFVIAVTRAVLAGANLGSSLFPLAVLAVIGLVPGALLGWFVEQSRELVRNPG